MTGLPHKSYKITKRQTPRVGSDDGLNARSFDEASPTTVPHTYPYSSAALACPVTIFWTLETAPFPVSCFHFPQEAFQIEFFFVLALVPQLADFV